MCTACGLLGAQSIVSGSARQSSQRRNHEVKSIRLYHTGVPVHTDTERSPERSPRLLPQSVKCKDEKVDIDIKFYANAGFAG